LTSPRIQQFLLELQQREREFQRKLARPISAATCAHAEPWSRPHQRGVSDSTNGNLPGIADAPSKDAIRDQLLRICAAWDDFQASRRRDAVYQFLKAVYILVVRYEGRRRTSRLIRRACIFANLLYKNRLEPFTIIIRATTEESVDIRTRSKWSRALRYVAFRKRAPRKLMSFMKAKGGINACAGRYTQIKRPKGESRRKR